MLAANKEIEEAIGELFDEIHETKDFKQQFKKMIINYLNNTFNENDLFFTINLIDHDFLGDSNGS